MEQMSPQEFEDSRHEDWALEEQMIKSTEIYPIWRGREAWGTQVSWKKGQIGVIDQIWYEGGNIVFAKRILEIYAGSDKDLPATGVYALDLP